ncbi:GNAT family N-acetyltransferase [Salinisphaera sp.]|uniref:GNAT family N-acetyltransferase n=1 Tax=Salinisphaera sp. TaxID=1914330 RepID=UPI000C5D6B6D|nr:GNAT family N-acetyltransferase [Salinisphaera sp.]MBS62545.1 GNAT family N-acetyltransferase [Salinisphaera sp.]
MTHCLLKPATGAADHQHLGELAHRIWHQHYPGIISREQIDYMLASQYTVHALADQQAQGTRFVLAWVGDTPAGFAAVSPDEQAGDIAWLDKLYLLAENRGQGIGGQLIGWARETAGTLDARALCLRVNRDNAASVAMYRHAGFEIEREDVKSIGNGFVMDDYVMRLPLDGR